MITCHLHKLRVLLLGGTNAHAETCSACQQESAEMSKIERDLRNEKLSHSPAPGFYLRLESKLDRSADATPGASRNVLWPRLVFAMATLALSAVLFLQVDGKSPTQLSQINSPPSEPVMEIPPLPQLSSEQLAQISVKLDQPLQKELQSVISDTRQAIQFVAANFMPDDSQ